MSYSVKKLDNIENSVSKCTKCNLCLTRNKTVPGEGPVHSKIMFIGEAPGKVNDETGKPFVGHGGKIFDNILMQLGIDRKNVFFVTNMVKCWPPENRRPKKREIEKCYPYLYDQIKIIKPQLIITLGKVAYERLTNKPIKIKEEHGIVTTIFDDIKVCSTYHPNGIRYVKGGMATIIEDIKNAMVLIN